MKLRITRPLQVKLLPRQFVTACLLAVVAIGSTHATADTVGYRLTIERQTGPETFNVPSFTLVNESSAGIEITAFDFTIGDTTKNFDQGLVITLGFGEILLTPDRLNDSVRSDIISWTFTGIPAGADFTFQADVDDDTIGNAVEDFRTVFFNNGAASNSTITVAFSNGNILSQTIPDQSPGLDTYSFSEMQSGDAQVYGGVNFPAGASSFADRVVRYQPDFGGGPVPDITSQDARQILGVPEIGGVSLGNGGRIIVKFLDNSLTGSNDSQPDLYIFEVGAAETTFVEIRKRGGSWLSVGTATGFAFGIDIDQFGFGQGDNFSFVRLTDDGDSGGGVPFVQGADLVAVGARSSAPPVRKQPSIKYYIQAHIGGLTELIIQDNLLQWNHIKGTAPGRAQGSLGDNSATMIDSNQGPNIPWVATGIPGTIGNGTHPEFFSDAFDALTPVLPADGKCWRLKKLSGAGKVEIVQQPNSANDFSLVILFDDLKKGAISNLAGSGFYLIRLTPRKGKC